MKYKGYSDFSDFQLSKMGLWMINRKVQNLFFLEKGRFLCII